MANYLKAKRHDFVIKSLRVKKNHQGFAIKIIQFKHTGSISIVEGWDQSIITAA
jgi:hypothetical protein